MKQDISNYFRQRERAERAAAKAATCGSARKVHQDLARLYAARTRELVSAD
jgi:hypothetical protein